MINWKSPRVYAVKHRNENIREASRSGGVFTALSDKVLSENGIVYGCALTEDFQAVHIRAEKAEERNLMRGSKYIQSSMGDVFKSVQKDLNAGKKVMFSGTSCQAAGLKKYLGKEYSNLLCVDILCYGVPSALVWSEYLNWQESRNGKITDVDFRNKKDFGWTSHIETIVFENKKVADSRVFTTLFLGKYILRPSCYKCPYKDIMHPADITIGDYWGIDKAVPGFNDNKGVSLTLINNDIGEKYFELIKNEIIYHEAGLEDSMQPVLVKAVDMPAQRERFWKDFYALDFEEVIRNYGGYGLKEKLKMIKRKLKRRAGSAKSNK